MLTANLYEDNNAGIILVIHDGKNNAKYIHLYQGTIAGDTGYNIEGDHIWAETDDYSLGMDLIAFEAHPESCRYWDNNQLGMYENGDTMPDRFNPRIMEHNNGVREVAEQAYKTIATNMERLEAGYVGRKMVDSMACMAYYK